MGNCLLKFGRCCFMHRLCSQDKLPVSRKKRMTWKERVHEEVRCRGHRGQEPVLNYLLLCRTRALRSPQRPRGLSPSRALCTATTL